VLWVIDGDGLRVEANDTAEEIRLADIDAPERDQSYGWQATLELIDLVRDREILVTPRDVDHYGRIVADIEIDGRNVSRELVGRGAAWFNSKYARDETLYRVEQSARDARRGLWALPVGQRVEPWVWRKARAAQKDSHESGKPVGGKDSIESR
jgi:endonuclease YncB( thermonuclease family)